MKSFCYQDSPRRAHSIAAQGGINAAKNYKEDGDSVHRLFYDTVKGGDYRSRESNVYRLAEVSANIIDQCVAQGVPFAREYGGLLDNRSFGGVQVSRTFYARGQTGQQLLIGAYQALERQVAAGTVSTLHPPRDARADRRRRQGPRHHRPRHGHRRDRDPPRRRRRARLRWLRQRLLPLDQRDGLQRHRRVARAPQGRLHGQPLLHADPPDLHPGLGRAPVEADADVASRCATTAGSGCRRTRPTATRTRARSPRTTATTTSSGSTPPSATWSPATSPRARPRTSATRAAASGPRSTASAAASTSTSPTPSSAWAATAIEEKYDNLFDMYERITGENPYEVPMRIYPAVHYVMGGLWVDYDLQSTIPGPVRHRRGQLLRPRRQPPRRLGADAGPGRRLLRAAAHHPRLPRRRPVREDRRGPPGRRRGAASPSQDRIDALPDRQRHPQRRLLPPRARQHHVGVLRHGAHRGRPEEGDRPDPRAQGRLLAQREGARHRRDASTRPSRRPAASPTSSSSAS